MANPTATPIDLQDVLVDVRALRLSSAESAIEFARFSLTLTKDAPCCRVIGPSGSGKTTFFKSLIDRFRQDWMTYSAPEIDIVFRVNGLAFSFDTCEIGYAAQNPFFLPHLTVRENLVAPYRWRGEPEPADGEVGAILEDFELLAIVDRRGYQLSAGERQRLNLARTFISRPELVIIDECLTPMDEAMAQKIGDRIATKYCDGCRLLITGHRSSDLAPFGPHSATFAYRDERPGKVPLRKVEVTVT